MHRFPTTWQRPESLQNYRWKHYKKGCTSLYIYSIYLPNTLTVYLLYKMRGHDMEPPGILISQKSIWFPTKCRETCGYEVVAYYYLHPSVVGLMAALLVVKMHGGIQALYWIYELYSIHSPSAKSIRRSNLRVAEQRSGPISAWNWCGAQVARAALSSRGALCRPSLPFQCRPKQTNGVLSHRNGQEGRVGREPVWFLIFSGSCLSRNKLINSWTDRASLLSIEAGLVLTPEHGPVSRAN